VRQYELDSFGHVNNAVYLNYAEQAATDHADSLGLGREWCTENGGTWVVRRHEITYHQPALYGDELEIITVADSFRGATGTRKTTISRVMDATLLADIATEWVWLKMPEGRPSRVPAEILEKLGS